MGMSTQYVPYKLHVSSLCG